MRTFLKCAIFCLLFLAVKPAFAVVDVVFDIDWTLFYTTSAESVQQDPARTYQYNGVFYRMSEGAPEVLLQLQQQGFRLSTFSGGQNDRNDFLVAQLVKESEKLPNGPLHFYKQLGFNELSRREKPASSRFADTYMKDLRLINPDLDSVVVVDDMAKFSPQGQERNLLWLSRVYNDRLKFDPKKAGERFEPFTYQDWYQERKKLYFVLQTLEAIKKETALSKQNFVDLLSARMNELHPSCEGLF